MNKLSQQQQSKESKKGREQWDLGSRATNQIGGRGLAPVSTTAQCVVRSRPIKSAVGLKQKLATLFLIPWDASPFVVPLLFAVLCCYVLGLCVCVFLL